MAELDKFQDMLYNDKSSTVQHLLPPRRRNRGREKEEKKESEMRELSEAEKRLRDIDLEVKGFIEKNKEDRENNSDI